MTGFYWLTLGILSAWRVTHLLQAEDGPWDIVARLRLWAADGVLGRLLDCFYCLSIWVSLPLAAAIGEGWLERALLWPALSGGAILLQHMADRPPPIAHVEHLPEAAKENDDGVLRK